MLASRTITGRTAILRALDAAHLDRHVYRAILAHLRPDDVRITIRHHLDGWVANSYRWDAPGEYAEIAICGAGVSVCRGGYDRKRSYGAGADVTCYIARAGQTRGRRIRL